MHQGLEAYPSIEDIAESPVRRGCHDFIDRCAFQWAAEMASSDGAVFCAGADLVYLLMEKLFASKGIRVQSIKDLYESEVKMAYTGKPFELNVLIEFLALR